MYGVPADLDLSMFIGATLIQIAIGEYQVNFCFDGYRLVSVEGFWQVKNATGQILDSELKNSERDCYRVHRLLGRRVTGFQVHAPTSVVLQFDEGYTLEVVDSSTQYESFSIQPGDIFI